MTNFLNRYFNLTISETLVLQSHNLKDMHYGQAIQAWLIVSCVHNFSRIQIYVACFANMHVTYIHALVQQLFGTTGHLLRLHDNVIPFNNNRRYRSHKAGQSQSFHSSEEYLWIVSVGKCTHWALSELMRLIIVYIFKCRSIKSDRRAH